MTDIPTANINTEATYGSTPQGDQPATWWQIDYIGPLSPYIEQSFSFTGIAIYSGYGAAFPPGKDQDLLRFLSRVEVIQNG